MARITLDLNQFKASGVYTVEFDSSERVVLTTETVRLVVGFSRVGPFNAPVFLRDVATARRIFGNIDKTLEARGSFFHRSIETALLTGPVFALNLLPLRNIPVSDGGDAAEYKSFSLEMGSDNGIKVKELVSSWFDKERFWKIDTDSFNALANNNAINKEKLLHIANVSQKPMSIFIRKYNGTDFNVTAKEWYSSTDVPSYLNPNDLIKDTFIEITLIQGDWTNYTTLSQDPVFSRYFDQRGLKIDRLNEFLSVEEVTTIGNFVGSVIPDFIDQNGSNQSIENIVNNAFGTTGLFVTLNRELLENLVNTGAKIDLVGHSLIDSDNSYINFLSYNTSTSSALEYNNLNIIDIESLSNYDPQTLGELKTFPFNTGVEVTSMPLGGTSGFFGNALTIQKPLSGNTLTSSMYEEILTNLKENSLIWNGRSQYGEDFLKVESVIERPNSIEVKLSNPVFNEAIKENSIDSITFSPVTEVKFSGNDPFASANSNTGTVYIYGEGYYEYFDVTSTSSTTIELSGDTSELEAAVNAGLTLEMKTWLSDIDDDGTFANVTGSNQLVIIFQPNGNIEVEYSNGTKSIESYPYSPIAQDILENRLIDGDRIYNDNTMYYINIDEEYNQFINTASGLAYGITGTRLRQYNNEELTDQVADTDFIGIGDSYDSDAVATENDLLIYSSSVGELKYTIDIIEPNASQTKFKISQDDSNKLAVGYYIVNKNKEVLTSVKSKTRRFNETTGDTLFEIETLDGVNINNDKVTVIKPINQHADRLQLTYLSGFRLSEWHLPKNNEQLWKILGVIDDTNIGKGLISTDTITFRYIVDTFDFGVEPNMGAKSILSRLAKNRQKCMAILNAPSIKSFMNSTDPRFTDQPDPEAGNPKPVLNTEYIVQGGNLSLGPSFTFSLPDEENGSKFIGVFSPFITLRENNMNFNVPPAADVSNNFIRKFLNGQPYAITAGPRRGIISNPRMVGLEYDFTLEDREFLEPFGINPIVNVRGVGSMIFANQSAYQRTSSAFNNLHVRDLLITIETAIEDVLKQYLFEFNTPTTRLEIKSIVENYLTSVQNAEGLNDFSVIMDSVNNTNEIIDQKFAIIDVGIEPTIGAQKFINRITVLRTGAISSGGFTVA